MRRILFAVLALFVLAFQAQAQEIPGPGRLEHSNGEFYLDGQKLLPEQIQSVIGDDIYYETYKGAVVQRNTGKALLIAGGSSMGTGIALLAFGYYTSYKMVNDYLKSVRAGNGNSSDYASIISKAYGYEFMILGGYVLTLSGSGLLSAGIPLFSIGNSRLNWIEKDYNQKEGYSLNFGFTPNGVGFALKF